MDDGPVFEGIRKAIARGRKTASWDRTEAELKDVVYEAVHPGLIACRIYVDTEELGRAEQESKQVGKRHLIIGVAVSKEFTRDKFRVYTKMSRYGARYNLRMDKLLPLPNYGTSSHCDGPGPRVEDMIDDFRISFPAIVRSFKDLEPIVAQPFINLVNIAAQVRPFERNRLWNDSSRRYYPKDEGEFVFLEGPLDHVYGPSFL